MDAYITSKVMTHTGELGSRCQPLTWAQMEPALPPKEHCAAIPLESLCDGPVLEYLLHPERSLVDLSGVAACPKPGKLHVRPGELNRIAKGLLERRLVRPVLAHELIMVAGRPLLNGFFGVGKGKFLGPEAGVDSGLEVLRFIMNLSCTNSLCRPFKGDIGALPFYG